ncbi:MAG: peroxide stress protein YaaA [Propionibacteriaceae bacterium]|jgi:cytoplasmic iron level regulating protein YaaA (DUF328/UPF0246 family)|nr:peroxide stress protein YaaA [Propionibacteriaceae bacterium]
MLILLPPSESKAAPRRRGTPVDLATLSAPELAETREAILTELMKVSAEPDAADVLGVSSGRLAEVRRNVDLDRLPRAPTMKVYAGVLYDALDFATLSAAARRRAGRSLRVQSALWGPVGPADLIAPYRLSMATTLPRLGSLARLWRGVLDPVMAKLAGSGVIVDCRSASYAAAWQPSGEAVRRSVSIRVFTEAAGRRTVVSHLAKHTRGLVARALLEAPRAPRTVADVATVLEQHWRAELVDLGRRGFALDLIEEP